MSYSVNERGIVVSPEKFEGEPEYVMHFWKLALDGQADADMGGIFFFELEIDDKMDFPALFGYRSIMLYEDSSGFVRHRLGYLQGDLVIYRATDPVDKSSRPWYNPQDNPGKLK